jgi:hypothetical protein
VSEFPYRLRGVEAVTAVVATVRSDPAFVAGCLVVGGAHGYSMEIEYVRRDDGTTRYRVWSDVQGIISTDETRTDVDFAAVLASVNAAGLAGTQLPDDPRSRRALVVLATTAGGTWVDTPTPTGTARVASPLDPIFDLVFPS